LLWATAFGVGPSSPGERGPRALFLLPAVLFTVAVVIFPTLFGIYIASLD
jgi:multiple sugar transport system permease protein